MRVRGRCGYPFAVAALVLLSSTIAAAATPLEVDVSPATVIVVSDPAALQKRCRVERKIIACTWFQDEKLECRCHQEGEGWRITPRASFAPVMLVLADDWQIRRHETVHVRDVASRLRAHMKRIAANRHGSQEECESVAAALADAGAFVQVMNEFRRESNEKYQCAKPSR